MSQTITESEKTQLHISVRRLVEFIFREGDIDNRGGRLVSPDAMLMGTRTHRRIQKSQGDNYQAEVPLKITIPAELYDLTLEGRADGIFSEAPEKREEEEIFPADFMEMDKAEANCPYPAAWIDEIKGIFHNPKHMEGPLLVHLAQARCYAYIYALQQDLTEIGVQITYCNMDTEEIRRFREVHTFKALSVWFFDLMKEYQKWADFECSWKKIRQESIKELAFPYAYRPGQKKLASDVYRTILRKKVLFIQAPTGVGKTISTVYPAVKAIGENLADRIFYLTAKTMTAQAAWNTFELLAQKGYQGKTLQITAKEKMCLCEEMECNPINCPYAKGHFDRINDAIYDLLTRQDFYSRETIRQHAAKYLVCPFELSLDLSLFSDNIICDYNYVFDPNVYLKRFFGDTVKGDYLFLVDEAHNLVDRSREMYSAVLYKEDFLAARRILKGISEPVRRELDRCNRVLLEYKRETETYRIYPDIANFSHALGKLASDLDELLQKPKDFAGRKEITDFYFQIRHFRNIYEILDEHYCIYTQMEEDGRFAMKLFCVDPSENLGKCVDRAISTIFFSATLLPVNYYKNLLCNQEEPYAIYAASPFTRDQWLLLAGSDVSTRYTRRGIREYNRIADYIIRFISCKKGNYMVFFPSYKMLADVGECLTERIPLTLPDVKVLEQTAGMSEGEREAFLENFEGPSEKSLLALCVMGGIFSEGIDLTREKLIGAVIVGTGLPQISNEREILKNYYEEHMGAGFDYAFRYPGMNKVLQSAGRVIRTAEDKGAILLLDDRFLQRENLDLLPREWEDLKVVTPENLEALVRDFWKENTK